MLQAVWPANLFRGALETKELPERLNRILERFADTPGEVKVDANRRGRLM